MWGVIAHRLKKLLTHAAKEQVHFDRWGSRQGYITHNYLGDINQMQVAFKRLKRKWKEIISTLKSTLDLCGPSSGPVHWMDWECVGSRDHVKSLIMTTSQRMQRLQKCFNVGQNEEHIGVRTSLLFVRESHVALTWCSRTCCWGLRAKKKCIANLHESVSSITGKFPSSSRKNWSFTNAHKGTQGSETQMQPRLCQRCPPDVLC